MCSSGKNRLVVVCRAVHVNLAAACQARQAICWGILRAAASAQAGGIVQQQGDCEDSCACACTAGITLELMVLIGLTC